MSLTGRQRVATASAAAALAGVLTFTLAGWQGGSASASLPVPADPAASASAVSSSAVPAGSVPAGSVPDSAAPGGARPVASGSTPTAHAARQVSRMAVAGPSRLRIPRLDADLPVSPVGLDRDGAMALPASPSQAGWYRFGPHPGVAGATVIAAHVDAPGEGRGPLAGLVRLSPGDAVEVVVGSVTLQYRVTTVLRINKGELDPDEVFARTGPERLHIVSCGGRFDRAAGHYEDNVIAIAVPVRQP